MAGFSSASTWTSSTAARGERRNAAIAGRTCAGCAQRKPSAQMFGHPDYLKLHSSLTLFHHVSPPDQIFTQALGQLYGGELDQAMVRLLQGQLRAPPP
jgi:uncharacterized protein (DUF1810 family)